MKAAEYFRDQVCIVTGAASGIGLALSQGLLQHGATVIMADRDESTLASATAGLGDFAGRFHPRRVDVASEEDVQGLVEGTAERHGRLDVLFNNAGVGGTLPIEHATLQHWRRLVDVNLWGVVYGTHFALPIMRRQGRGHVVNTASVAGLVPFPYQALYAATKYGVVGLSECLRLELQDEGVHFSVVCPGNVATRIFGTPILGERVDVKPPDDSISADEAARIILDGVANLEGIIVLPEAPRQLWLQYGRAPEEVETFLRDLAVQRREAYRAQGVIG